MLQASSFAARLSQFFKPRCRVLSNPSKYVFEYELPGVPKDAVDVSCGEDSILTVKATKVDEVDNNTKIVRSERNFGLFERKIKLPEDAKVAEIDASLNLGVLTISVPRQTVEDKDKRITIRVN